MWRPVTRVALLVMIASGVALGVTGDIQAKLMFEQQPMKMASAEALCHTEQPAAFSILTVGDQGNLATLSNALSWPQAFGLEPSEASHIVDSMLEQTSRWRRVFSHHGVLADDIQKIADGHCFGS